MDSILGNKKWYDKEGDGDDSDLDGDANKNKQKWKSLEHHAVIFFP